MSLTKQQILDMDDLPKKEIKIPEWGGATVFVRTMTAGERDAYENGIMTERTNIRSRLVAMCLCDEQGNQLFTQDDVEALGKKSGKALDRIFNASVHINKITKKDLEELEKSFSEAQPESSSSN